jgi:hypothetical protein
VLCCVVLCWGEKGMDEVDMLVRWCVQLDVWGMGGKTGSGPFGFDGSASQSLSASMCARVCVRERERLTDRSGRRGRGRCRSSSRRGG